MLIVRPSNCHPFLTAWYLGRKKGRGRVVNQPGLGWHRLPRDRENRRIERALWWKDFRWMLRHPIRYFGRGLNRS
jgi:hypothetical protein